MPDETGESVPHPYPTNGGVRCGHPGPHGMGCRLDKGHPGLHQIVMLGAAPSGRTPDA